MLARVFKSKLKDNNDESAENNGVLRGPIVQHTL
jgi:hypothetical protein